MIAWLTESCLGWSQNVLYCNRYNKVRLCWSNKTRKSFRVTTYLSIVIEQHHIHICDSMVD